MHFTGREEIAVGGGEEIFVYVNKILVLQVQREYQSVTDCKKVSLANADGELVSGWDLNHVPCHLSDLYTPDHNTSTVLPLTIVFIFFIK